MRNQPILIIVSWRSSAKSLVIVLVAMFFVSCKSAQPSQSSAPQSSNPTPKESLVKSYHDIPPDIVIDVGSFIIETNKPFPPPSGSPGSPFIGNYEAPSGSRVDIALIKIVRTDDGAIIYQNFNAVGTYIEFTTMSGPGITIKPVNMNSAIKFDIRPGIQQVETINLHGRKQRLKNNNIKIKNVTVKKVENTQERILFTHDISDDGQYRVIMLIEIK